MKCQSSNKLNENLADQLKPSTCTGKGHTPVESAHGLGTSSSCKKHKSCTGKGHTPVKSAHGLGTSSSCNKHCGPNTQETRDQPPGKCLNQPLGQTPAVHGPICASTQPRATQMCGHHKLLAVQMQGHQVTKIECSEEPKGRRHDASARIFFQYGCFSSCGEVKTENLSS